MDSLNEDNLAQIELLLAQSLKGHHHLFDKQLIAEILKTPTQDKDFFSFENMERIQDLFSKLIEKQSFHEKQQFLRKLDIESYEILVRTYFHIVENTMLAANSIKH